MSVIMVLTTNGDGSKLEEFAAADPDRMEQIRNKAVERGLIAHRFFTDDNGHVLVVDEWPDKESFQKFFAETQDEIGSMLAPAELEPVGEPQFLRVLESHDKYGWDA